MLTSSRLFHLVRGVYRCVSQRGNFLEVLQRFLIQTNLILFQPFLLYSTHMMSSPGEKRGTCGHVMALFDSHKKCVTCREKGVGDDPCVKKLDCQICKAFTPAQIQQLATPTYKSRKEREQRRL